MIDKETRKRLKQIEKEISKLKKQIKKAEFRPCQSDLELKQKDEDIKAHRDRINELEKEHDRYILKSGNIEQSPWGLTISIDDIWNIDYFWVLARVPEIKGFKQHDFYGILSMYLEFALNELWSSLTG